MATAHTLRWSDPRVKSVVWQVLILGTIAALVGFLVVNVNTNLAARHIATGFGFLDRQAHIPIAETLVPYSDATSTFGRALLEGLLNTLRVAVAGIVLATVLGTLVGIGQLSPNALLSRICAIYVEVVRDIPVLVQLLIWYAILKLLPGPRQAIQFGGTFLSNRGIVIPVPVASPAWSAMLWAALAGIVLAWFWARWTRARRARTGRAPPRPVDRGRHRRRSAVAGLARVRRADGSRPPRAARLQLHRRQPAQPGIRRIADGLGRLHRRLHRRGRALRPARRQPRADRGGDGARPVARPDAAADRAAAGVAGHHLRR